jgi:release factor glutamine methyltransferase
VLLRHVLALDRTQLFLRYPDPLLAVDRTAFEQLIARRLEGAPVAYLTGTREFMGLPFHVAPGVLIPRPDTEPLVEWALEWLGNRRNARIADIGTGSGAIAISLAAHLPDTFVGEIIAIDTSEEALAIARENAAHMLGQERQQQLSFTRGSLTEPLTDPVDLVLANLPYLTPAQIAQNTDLDAEPRGALDGGPDGLDLVRDVISDLPRILVADGAAGFEIDPSQAKTVSSLLKAAVPDSTIQIVPDLAQLSRHVVVTHP